MTVRAYLQDQVSQQGKTSKLLSRDEIPYLKNDILLLLGLIEMEVQILVSSLEYMQT